MRRVYIIVLLSMTFICHACGNNFERPGEIDPDVILKGSFESKFVRYAEGDGFAGIALKIWSDTVWQNDRIHKQLILWSEEGTFRKLSYAVSDLKSENYTIDGNNLQLRFGKYVKGDSQALDCGMQSDIRTGVLQADALSPKVVTSLSTDDPLKIWLTLNIPADAAPGRYTGSIAVKEDDIEIEKFDMDIMVVNHKLPDVKDWNFHLDLWQFPFQLTKLVDQRENSIQPFSEKYFKLVKPFYTMLADAGQAAITTYIKDGAFDKGQSMVKWTKKTDGTWSFDYTDFDGFVETMIEWDIVRQINCFSLVGWDVSVQYYDEKSSNQSVLNFDVNDPLYESVWNDFLLSFYNHLTQKGWFEKAVLYMDEIEEDKMKKVIEIVKNNNVNWKIGLTGKNPSASIASQLYDYSAILGDNRSYRTPVSTFYTSCSNIIPNNYVTPQNNPAEMTWMAWYAAANDYDGYLRWAYDYWKNIDPANAQDGSNTAGDFSMIYRSDNTLSTYPISSMRLELLREGIQDYEKIRILSNSQVNTYLSQFDETSGINSRKLVEKGQSLIKQISSQN